MQLPVKVVAAMFAKRGFANWTEIVTRAMQRVLRGTPADRARMMQAAFPVMDSGAYGVPHVAVDPKLAAEFDRFCQAKMLPSDVLLAGAILEQIGARGEQFDASSVPASLVAETASAESASKPWWRVW